MASRLKPSGAGTLFSYPKSPMSPSKQNNHKNEFVFRLYACPLPFPLTFAAHTYVTLEHAGCIDRYEVIPMLGLRTLGKTGHVRQNLLAPEAGFRYFGKYPFNFGPSYKVKCCAEITAGYGSGVERLYQFIQSDGLEQYPHKSKYRMLGGPNSNTFTQWLVDMITDSKINLPSNAWGKNFKV